MYVVKEQERSVRSCLLFPFLHVLWPLWIGIPLRIIEAQCMGTSLQVTEDQDSRMWHKSHGWLKRQERKIGGNEFSQVYAKDLANIIWICLWWLSCGLEEQSLLLSMSKERRMNHENWTCVPGQVCLLLKRHKSCQFICSLLRRIIVVKEGRSTLCYHLILLLSSEHWFLMQFLYKQRMYFVWWELSFFFSFLFFFFSICSEFCHTLKWKGLGFTCLPHPDPPSHLPPPINLWGCSGPRHMGPWDLAGSVSAQSAVYVDLLSSGAWVISSVWVYIWGVNSSWV